LSDKISSSVYNIQKKWIEEIAPNYFNIDEINLLQIGLFGYINEVMSNSVEDSAYMFQVLSNEIYPNKAVLPNSIYNYSALAQYNDFHAKPSNIPFILALRKADIIKYSDDKISYKELIISRYSKLVIEEEIPFMIDYDIRIISKLTPDKTDYILTAQYILDINNPISSIKSPYIKSMVLTEQSEEFLFIRLNAHQIDRIEKKFMVYSNDIVENLNFETSYEGSLAEFNVYYKSANSNSYIQLSKYFVDSYKPKEKYFCFYNYTGENKINISFAAHPNYFKPEFNSELMIEIFVTKGKEGNFTYTGTTAEFNFFSIGNKDFSKILTFTQVLGDSYGGVDRLPIEDIKQNVIKEFSSRGNLITDSDLKNYFDSVTDNCDIYFLKKRDDLITRIYSAFLLLRDADNNIIPTNTVNINITDEEFDNYVPGSTTNTLKAGTLFRITDVENNIVEKDPVLYNNNDLIEQDQNPDNYLYGCPFLIKLNKDPYFISYYLNSVFDKYILEFNYINRDALDEFIINSLYIERNSIDSPDYKISLSLTSSIDTNLIANIDETGSLISDLGNLKIKGFIKEDGVYKGYVNFDLTSLDVTNLTYNFETRLTTDDFINSEDRLNLVSSVYRLDNVSEIIYEGFSIGNDNVILDIAVYYNGYTNKSKETYIDFVPGLEDYCITNIYSTESNIQLFKNLNNIISSNVILKGINSEEGIYYKIKSVPMVRYIYLKQDRNMKILIKLLDKFKDILMNTLDLIENNFNIDLKFYNTYGKSLFFTIGRTGDKLNKTGIKIQLNIKINREINDTLISSIKKFIIDNVESTNENATNYLYISNLIRKLELNFESIAFIEFLGFNSYDSSYQIIENTFSGFNNLSKEQVNNFIPEYLNINRIPALSDSNEIMFIPDIEINLV